MQAPAQSFTVQRSNERYFANHGWLQTYHSFSFADYYDRKNTNWGALRVFNDDVIAPASGFPEHPHRDMEIVTYVLSGELRHADSMGNVGVVRAGGVQYMSAGTGVRHSEVNPSPDQPLHLVQMWVLPGQLGAKPLYGQIDFTEDDRRNVWLTVASGQPGIDTPIALTQTATLAVAHLDDTALTRAQEPGRYGFLFCASGDVLANGIELQAGDAVRMASVTSLTVGGSGDIVFWDVPAAP